MTTPLYRDASASFSDRIDDLLGRMTVEEKAGQLTQYFYFGAPEMPADFDIDALPPEHRAFLEQPKAVDRVLEKGAVGSILFVTDVRLTTRLQKVAVEETRLGIPLLFGFDVIHGFRTVFPVPIALAASWNPAIIERAQTVAAREARAVGIHWAFAPMIDIARDPRWGRIVESAGEDPVLGAAVAAAQVRGFQGDLGEDRVLAGPKHLAGYGAARGGRDYDDAEVSDSELRNVYLPPFRAAIDAGAANVMSAYMDLNGVPASANRWLLTEVLRDEMGFEGFVVSDANAVRSLETQHFASDLTDAAVRSLEAGLDMEMAISDAAFSRLPEAVAQGRIDESVLDTAVRRVLEAKFRLGLFERPYADASTVDDVLDASDHREIARIAAAQSFVLLKNADNALPLSSERVGTVAVVGQLADSPRDMLGPWVFNHDTAETVTVLDGLRSRLGSDAVIHAPGAGILERMFPTAMDQADPSIASTPDDWDDDSEIERAVAAAAAADVAVVVVGHRQNQAGEGASTSTLDLPGRQQEQLERIAATGTPVVLVVVTGRPVDLRWADANVPAILQAWYPGTRGGDAIAATLLGEDSPAGRLPFTWPRHVGQVPMIHSHLRTFAPQDQGKRYFEEESTPLYPFGHGLSYAEFEYSGLRLDRDTIAVGDTASVSVDIRNTSDRTADDVAQLYIHQRHGASSRPLRELKGFERITLAPGEQRTVTFPVGPDQLRYWSAATRSDTQDATTVDLGVGPSSTVPLDISLTITPARAR
ncbi:beta-glucosidase [Rathayibacter sp. PhB93]|uniref:glycoside hydrolase family 3 N-terminal domain-containing protein n=1 Tax=unclassified Rathayibacter TaxID=2609250 RepID=UPI000F496347|nr:MULTISPECIES: glycoside hydrolase family 3 N-terminal domain-containing protein [unclassified Rathayibacter]ROQ00954.1 beta-glucosidase [Rathayibacter sp. PhB93]TDQ07308.1 beta-glucosidase [Rathayibacter sp. PhB1]